MGKKQQQQSHTEPVHLDHLTTPPKVRTSHDVKFDNLEQFEAYIKDESWDNEFDNLNAHLTYLPPFIMHEIHDNEENIKPQMNCLNKKFRRQLHHHLVKHLIPDISKMAGVDYQFDKAEEEQISNAYGTSTIYKWHFKDESNHGFDEKEFESRNHWIAELNVESNSSDPFVTVDFKCVPTI
ncbi:hypothetical protein CANARDRAFT_30622 [[Candida] arabinofermentans NRRL YB-2248]|uniref:Respiratory growth induced protein 1 n=1 Tax=[Candida] arabinofermentans NRRL YB-2248 TaxID=983967 RepID=A0A1E4ST74_9ASCO|nr:hypothetical protein CANARDRAFT_30622 [[Candida] arabinofermentans NRRL YB-2248]